DDVLWAHDHPPGMVSAPGVAPGARGVVGHGLAWDLALHKRGLLCKKKAPACVGGIERNAPIPCARRDGGAFRMPMGGSSGQAARPGRATGVEDRKSVV